MDVNFKIYHFLDCIYRSMSPQVSINLSEIFSRFAFCLSHDGKLRAQLAHLSDKLLTYFVLNFRLTQELFQ
jgi:hypothetical protein